MALFLVTVLLAAEPTTAAITTTYARTSTTPRARNRPISFLAPSDSTSSHGDPAVVWANSAVSGGWPTGLLKVPGPAGTVAGRPGKAWPAKPAGWPPGSAG